MNLYIDKTNLLSFINSKDNPRFSKCLELIQGQLDIKFNFKKEELLSDPRLMNFIPTLTEGAGDTSPNEWDVSFPERPLKSNTYTKFLPEQLSAIYLIDDEKIKVFKDTGAVIVGAPEQEIDIIYGLFLHPKNCYLEKDLRIGSNEFLSWTDIENFSYPLSDIIIIDPYIFKQNSSNIDLLEENLFALLRSVYSKSASKLNIVIATNPNNINFDLHEVSQRIKNQVKKDIGKKVNVTIIPTYSEHDRTIITNYIRYYSGDSFNYFEKGRKKTNGKDLMIKSLVRQDYYTRAMEAIQDVQSIIDKNKSKDGIFGDQESGYLNF